MYVYIYIYIYSYETWSSMQCIFGRRFFFPSSLTAPRLDRHMFLLHFLFRGLWGSPLGQVGYDGHGGSWSPRRKGQPFLDVSGMDVIAIPQSRSQNGPSWHKGPQMSGFQDVSSDPTGWWCCSVHGDWPLLECPSQWVVSKRSVMIHLHPSPNYMEDVDCGRWGIQIHLPQSTSTSFLAPSSYIQIRFFSEHPNFWRFKVSKRYEVPICASLRLKILLQPYLHPPPHFSARNWHQCLGASADFCWHVPSQCWSSSRVPSRTFT